MDNSTFVNNRQYIEFMDNRQYICGSQLVHLSTIESAFVDNRQHICGQKTVHLWTTDSIFVDNENYIPLPTATVSRVLESSANRLQNIIHLVIKLAPATEHLMALAIGRSIKQIKES